MAGARRLVVGRIVTAHGIRGECVVDVLSDAPDRFDPGRTVQIDEPDGRRMLTVEAARPHKARLLVLFSEVPDRTAAEALRGRWLTIPAEDAAPLPEGRFYPHQIEGFDVRDEAGAPLGVLESVLEYPAHDIWVVRTPDRREVMVPAVAEFVRGVDPEAKSIVLAPIEGMFE
ncbi:MAG TPA: ribosome maturation factor RimM [Actinomycetota bacterium]|nr:ribosome maturation factor RimM [Actinomycetota bacterium]